jgi:hypothetical protein
LAAETEITIPNGDFAQPDSSQMPYFSSPNNSQSFIPYWIASIPDKTGVFYNAMTITDPTYGTFPNPLALYNLTSTQAGFIYASPGGEMHQELTAATYQANQYYRLQFSLKASIDTTPYVGAIPLGAPIEVLFYYQNPANIIASTIVTNTGATPLGGGHYMTDQNNLSPFEVITPIVKPNDKWVNEYIGIQIIIPTNSPNLGGVWDVGNLKLTTDTPEPASLAILGCGVVILTARRRRAVNT